MNSVRNERRDYPVELAPESTIGGFEHIVGILLFLQRRLQLPNLGGMTFLYPGKLFRVRLLLSILRFFKDRSKCGRGLVEEMGQISPPLLARLLDLGGEGV